MTLDEYQDAARSTALYPQEVRVLYPTLKLAGEAGEADQLLAFRPGEHPVDRQAAVAPGAELSEVQRNAMAAELGDVMWYVANLAADLGLSLDEVGRGNLEKLASRKARGVLHGSGDDR